VSAGGILLVWTHKNVIDHQQAPPAAVVMEAPQIDPWILTQRLYKNDEGTQIFRTTDPEWVVKWNPSQDFQQVERLFLRRVLFCGGPRIRNMIEIPTDLAHQMGSRWYAMRAYAGSVLDESHVARMPWRRIALDVLDFLEDLHREYAHVHLDIVTRNILIDRRTGKYIVADYELVRRPDTSMDLRLDTLESDTAWYYLSHGAEIGKPCQTWRMDLLMLGSVLLELTVPCPGFSWSVWRACTAARAAGKSLSLERATTIHEEWATAIQFAHPVVRDYIRAVQELVTWEQEGPPDAVVYEALRESLRTPSPSPSPPLDSVS
jgi:hypothetical protein